MPNLFDSANYPYVEPTALVVGDRWAWKRSDLNSDYDNTLYTLTYEAVRNGLDNASISITASASGTDYLVEVASATTDGYVEGAYQWSMFVTRDSDSERVRLAQGTWVLARDVADDKSDPRTYNQRMLEAVQATLEGRATQAHSAYSIEGRSVTRMTPSELEQWRRLYEHRVAADLNTVRIRNGQLGFNRVQVRF